ncbi:MAG: hypothetical protein IK015_04040 [Treponema sp.]|nr:hypothetical protein [Treponema sp.]
MKKSMNFVKTLAIMAAIILAVCMAVGCSNSSDSGSSGGGSGSGSATAYVGKLPVAYVKEGDPFNGKKYQFSSSIYKAAFKDGVLTITKSDAPDYSYHYSYDATNKRLYCIIRSKTEDGKKEWTDIKAYVTKDDKNLLTKFDCSADYVRDSAAAKFVAYTQLFSFTYEQTDSSLTLKPYFNGFTSGSDIFSNVSFSGSNSVGIANYSDLSRIHSEGVQVTIPAKDYTKTQVQGYVTKVDGNKLTCAKYDRDGKSYSFSVEVDVSSATGDAATATMKLTSMDTELKTACGQDVGAEFADMNFHAYADSAWTLINN